MDNAQRRMSTLAHHLVPPTVQQQQQRTGRAPCPEACPGCRSGRSCDSGLLGRSPCSAAAPAGGVLLAGQVAIITGAGKGIGEAAAKLFASQGASIVVADLDGAAAQQVVSDIQRSGGRAVAVAGDVTATDTPARIVKAAMDAFGRIDILVNNAGFTWDGVIHKMTADQWDIMLAVHCTAPFRLIQAASPHMREAAKAEMDGPAGRAAPRCIVNISSTSGTHGNSGQANYGTAKAGVVGLTKSVAKEWGMFNIRCNALAFGLIDTRLTQPKESGASIQVGGKAVSLGMPQGEQWRAAAEQMIPLRRIGTAEEAAGAILLLASPWASFITGEVIEVNGGAFT